MSNPDDVQFDEVTLLALAYAGDESPRPAASVRTRLLERVGGSVAAGFRFSFENEADWQPHAVPGIRMRVLSVDRTRGYSTLLLDVAPGTVFPAHHHAGAEECYVISGTVRTLGRVMRAGDFLHADEGTDHAELVSDTGCRVLLVVPAEEVLTPPFN